MSPGTLLKFVRGMPAPLTPTAFLDLDGPILDVSLRHYRVYADSTASLGGTPISQAAFWSAKRLKTPDHELLGLSGLPAKNAAYQTLKLQGIETPSYLAHDRLQPQTKESLRQIALRYRLVLVTLRQSRSALQNQLAALELSPFFASILSGPADRRTGWETKCELIRSAGIVPGPDDFFAGDTETDILAGRALGVTTVAVCNGIREESILRQMSPDLIVLTLADLTSTKILK